MRRIVRCCTRGTSAIPEDLRYEPVPNQERSPERMLTISADSLTASPGPDTGVGVSDERREHTAATRNMAARSKTTSTV